MIRALPWADFVLFFIRWIIWIRHAVAGQLVEPFSVDSIDDLVFNILPTPEGGVEKVFLESQLVGVKETDDGFRLGPPVLVRVHNAFGVRLV